MSASSKKKLRKEQNAAAMTERQKKEQKEAKKLARMTIAFVLAMCILVLAAVGVLLRDPVNTLINRNTVAITIGDHQIGAVEFNYYYCDAVNDFCSNLEDTYGEQAILYAQWFYGIDFSRPLNKQDYGNGQTWGDYFVSVAKQNAVSMYALYLKAQADPDYKISEDAQADIDITQQSLDMAAAALNYKNADAYLKSMYGPGAAADTYRRYFEMNIIASDYYNAHEDTLKYEISDFREFEKDKYDNYTCYTYTSATVGMTHYITGGTEDETGEKVYSEKEQADALAAAKKDADALAAGTYATVEDFKNAVKALELNKEKEVIKPTQSKDTYFQNVSNEDVRTWLSNPERKAGDVGIIEAKNTTTDADGKETSKVVGYYIVYFEGLRDNTAPMANVRHLLVKFKNGTLGDDGELTYSNESKEAALKEATDIYEAWKAGEKVDEESFTALVKEKSEDTDAGKANGGLIEDIHPESNLVQSFKDWSCEKHEPGDTEIIESEYGYHIMYYVSDDEYSLRDLMIKEELMAEDMKEWLEELQKAYTVTDVNLKRVYFDYIPS